MTRICSLSAGLGCAALLVLSPTVKADGPPLAPGYAPLSPSTFPAQGPPPTQPVTPPATMYGNAPAVVPRAAGSPAMGGPISAEPSPFRPQPYLTNAGPADGLGPIPPTGARVQSRAVSQINAFWHHKSAFGADTWLRVGLPVSKQLASSKLAGSAIVGATALIPLNQQLAHYARNARTPTVSGACWLPYMPLGNNSNFLVDTVHFD